MAIPSEVIMILHAGHQTQLSPESIDFNISDKHFCTIFIGTWSGKIKVFGNGGIKKDSFL